MVHAAAHSISVRMRKYTEIDHVTDKLGMELTWVLMTPFLWLWWLLWFVLSRPWAVALLISGVTVAYLWTRHHWQQTQRSKQKVGNKVITKFSTVTSAVLQVFPVHPNNGWVVCGMEQGVRVFSRFFPGLNTASLSCFAASTLIDMPPKKVLSLATSNKELSSWMQGVSTPPQHLGSHDRSHDQSHDHNDDLIKVTLQEIQENSSFLRSLLMRVKRIVRFAEKYATFLEGIIQYPMELKMEILERTWHSEGDRQCYLLTVPRDPSLLPYWWSLLVLTTPREKGVSVATLVMLPRKSDSHVAPALASQLCSLREHILMKKLKAYSSSTTIRGQQLHTGAPQDTYPLQSNLLEGDTDSAGNSPSLVRRGKQPAKRLNQHRRSLPARQPSSDSSGLLATRPKDTNTARQPPENGTGLATGGTTITSTNHSTAVANLPHPPTSPTTRSASGSTNQYTNLDAKYLSLVDKACQKMLSIVNATEEDDWVVVGTTKNVFITKRPAQKGENPPLNCVKGTGMIRAPPAFVLRVIKNPENAMKFNELLNEARVIHKVSDTVTLTHLLYKPIWPTTSRDFSLLNISGQLDEHTWVNCAISVVDPRIPEEQGYVRGHVVGGGYLIKDCPGKAEMCEVTYTTQVDLKGNIPSFIINKVSASQPLCVNLLRTLAEALYAEMKNDPQRMREFENTSPPIKLISSAKPIQSQPPHSNPEEEEGSGNLKTGPQDTAVVSSNPAETEANELENLEGKTAEQNSLQAQHERENGDPTNSLRFGTPTADLEDDSRQEGAQVTPKTAQDYHQAPTAAKEAQIETETTNHDDTLGPSTSSTSLENGMIVMETLETYTPPWISSSDEGEGEKEGERERVKKTRFELNLPAYQKDKENSGEQSDDSRYPSLTEETIAYPRHEGGVDFRTMANQTAGRVLEELFQVCSLDLTDPVTFTNQPNGWQFQEVHKDVLILRKRPSDSPLHSFMGKGIVKLSPQEVYDSIRNPQLRFTYDNMLKELHIVKRIEDGLYILHLHHETTQCFIKQSRDFCILVSERSEPGKQLLIGTSIEVPECPPNPNIIRGKVYCSGWVVEPRWIKNKLCTEITYLLQVDAGGVPISIMNFVSKRQPLAIAYLRDYLIATSLQFSSKENSPN